MRERRGKKKQSWPLAVLTGFCIGMIVVALAGLVFYTVMLGGAREDFRKLAQQVEAGAAQTPEGQAPAVYETLREQYPDLVGWVAMDGTELNYPVMQTPQTPEYYLRRDVEGKYSLAGTPFLDARCNADAGPCLIVYGHNMNDGSMFAPLEGYLEADYAAAHPRLRLDSLSERREFEVMAVLRFADSPEAAQAYYGVPASEEAFEACVQRLREDALYTTGVDAVWGDQLLLLSTCDSADSSKRILVAARRAA